MIGVLNNISENSFNDKIELEYSAPYMRRIIVSENKYVKIAAKIATIAVILTLFLNPLSSLFPPSFARIGKSAVPENATIADAELIRLNED